MAPHRVNCSHRGVSGLCSSEELFLAQYVTQEQVHITLRFYNCTRKPAITKSFFCIYETMSLHAVYSSYDYYRNDFLSVVKKKNSQAMKKVQKG